METVVEHLQKVQKEDPRKLVFASMDLNHILWQYAFANSYGTPNFMWNSAAFCGGGLHYAVTMILGAPVNAEIDVERCNHIVLWGSQFGHGANNNPGAGIGVWLKRRGEGLSSSRRPLCGHAAGKADEWIPNIPGTDGELALSIANVMVNELKIYDATS
jgi:anaerobic selenocysteine-containing dehydrogenase